MWRNSELDRVLQIARIDLALLKLKTILARQALSRKDYNPNQPRHPAGQPSGGQWMGKPGSESPDARQTRLNSRTRLAQNSQEFCDKQYARDIFQCKMVGIANCYAQAMVRLVACERGRTIPPLNY